MRKAKTEVRRHPQYHRRNQTSKNMCNPRKGSPKLGTKALHLDRGGNGVQNRICTIRHSTDVNSLSYEVRDRLGKPTLCESKTTLTSFSKDTNPVEGYLDLPIFIGNTNVHHRFYVMKLGKANMLVTLGQPWQRTYNGIPNWRREGINFE